MKKERNISVVIVVVICLLSMLSFSPTITIANALTNNLVNIENEKSGFTLKYSGTTAKFTHSKVSGGSVTLLKNKASVVQFDFVGTEISLVAVKNSVSGVANIFIDGKKDASIDLYSKKAIYNSVVYKKSGLSSSTKTHRIKVVVTGKKNINSKGIGVYFDAFRYLKISKGQINNNTSALPKIGDIDNLKKILKAAQDQGTIANNNYMRFGAPLAMASADSKESVTSSDANSSALDYSQTNVQVQGVDEADIVKTDGTFIYQVNNSEIIIAKANPTTDMKVVSKIAFKNQSNFTPSEMYVDKDQLTVIGTSYVELNNSNPTPYGFGGVKPQIAPDVFVGRMMPPIYNFNRTFTNVLVYNIKDRVNPNLVKEVSIEGYYISSRKINEFLYVITNKDLNVYALLNSTGVIDEQEYCPVYRDSAVSKDYIEKSLSTIRYFPDSIQTNYMVIAGMDLSTPSLPANITSYLGSGNNIYASTQNLYVSFTSYKNIFNSFRADTDNTENTSVYKFSLNKGNVTYSAKGEVQGHILNQFSMDEARDEFGEYFRIATTQGNSWDSSGANILKNNIFVLNKNMNTIGQINDIAPGEKIYSVRFMGKRAYMVTFKNVDPLFVIDLSIPEKPAILGQLKIPGFSDYLHPYDENHIIGFGKDTVESKDTALVLGMKMAMFDVSDVANPKQKFVELIGDRGTYSELLSNHKALLFSKEKNILAFPVTVMKVQANTNTEQTGFPAYGTFEYQGAYVYSIDSVKGFVKKGRITHLTDEDFIKASTYGFDYEKQIQRILYINDTLFTLSNKVLKANKMSNLDEINKIILR